MIRAAIVGLEWLGPQPRRQRAGKRGNPLHDGEHPPLRRRQPSSMRKRDCSGGNSLDAVLSDGAIGAAVGQWGRNMARNARGDRNRWPDMLMELRRSPSVLPLDGRSRPRWIRSCTAWRWWRPWLSGNSR